MTWSTRELADLAGTTVNTIRHYHSRGLLDAPERRYNGYKQYRIQHLVRLLKVRRIVELGVPLAQVEAAGNDGQALHGTLRQLDASLAVEIERMHRKRSDIAAILRVHAPVDTPRGFESVVAELSDADLSLLHIYGRLYDESELAGLKELVATEPIQVRREFDALRSDADEAVRHDVADRMAAETANWRSVERHGLTHDIPRRRRNERETRIAIAEALDELYNPAQRDVLRRVAASISRARRSVRTSESDHLNADLLTCA